MTKCLKCGYIRQASDTGPDYACPKCQAVYAKMAELHDKQLAQQATLEQARRTGSWSGVAADVLQREIDRVQLCTVENLPGATATEAMGVLSADYTFAFGAILETVAGLARNVAGSGASEKTVHHLRTGRATCLQAIKHQAGMLGADAVIGVRFDYEEFSGANGHGIIVVTATGTAVKCSPIDTETQAPNR